MGLMFFGTQRPQSAKPKVMERRFRVLLRCPDCDAEESVLACVGDEPGDPATVEDFAESGALDRIDQPCKRCGGDMSVVRQIDYLRTPEEARARV